jgi:hypothetical protein
MHEAYITIWQFFDQSAAKVFGGDNQAAGCHVQFTLIDVEGHRS